MAKHPFEKLIGEMLDLVNDVTSNDEKLAGQMKGSFKNDMLKIREFTQKLKDLNNKQRERISNESLSEKQKEKEKVFTDAKEKRFLKRLKKLKEEFEFKKNKAELRLEILDDYEKGKIPGTKPALHGKAPKSIDKEQDNQKKQSKKSLRAKGLKKYKKIGGKDDWLPL